jgi:hypothetical protein
MTAFRLTAPPPLVENDIERQCLDLLRLRGYWPVRLHAGTFRSVDGKRWIRGVEKGTPDYGALHELYPGFLLETKRPGGSPSRLQSAAIRNLQMGYRLAVCVADGALAFAAWLDRHECAARQRWARILTRGP